MSSRGDALTTIAQLVIDQTFPGVPANLLPQMLKLRRPQLVTAVSVAMAESGGNATARLYNYRDRAGIKHASNTPPKPGTYIPSSLSVDRGLWQINSHWHPEVTDAMADDPVQATAAAFRISGGFVNFRAWATYTNGAASRWYTAAGAAVDEEIEHHEHYNATHPGGLTGVLTDVGGTLDGAAHAAMAVPDFLGKLADPHVWMRVVQVVAGLGAVVLGAFLLQHDLTGGAIGAVTSTGKGAALGAAAKTAATAAL